MRTFTDISARKINIDLLSLIGLLPPGCFSFPFIFYLAGTWPTVGRCWGDTFTNTMLIAAFCFIFDCKVNRSLWTRLSLWDQLSNQCTLICQPFLVYFTGKSELSWQKHWLKLKHNHCPMSMSLHIFLLESLSKTYFMHTWIWVFLWASNAAPVTKFLSHGWQWNEP